MENREQLSGQHTEEVRVISKILNSKLFIAIAPATILTIVSWVSLAASYSDKVDTVIEQAEHQAKIDSINFLYLKQKNEDLINYMQTANQAIVNNNINYERLQVQYDYIQSELQDIKKRLNGTK